MLGAGVVQGFKKKKKIGLHFNGTIFPVKQPYLIVVFAVSLFVFYFLFCCYFHLDLSGMLFPVKQS